MVFFVNGILHYELSLLVGRKGERRRPTVVSETLESFDSPSHLRNCCMRDIDTAIRYSDCSSAIFTTPTEICINWAAKVMKPAKPRARVTRAIGVVQERTGTPIETCIVYPW